MFCTNCGQSLSGKEADFCSHCGSTRAPTAQESPANAQQQSLNAMVQQPPAVGISKNKIMIIIAIAIIIGGAMFFIIGNFNSSNSDNLVGFWESDYETLEIRADGTATQQYYSYPDGKLFKTEDYRWETAGRKLVMQDNTTNPYMQKNSDKNYPYKIKGNNLTLKVKLNSGRMRSDDYTKK